MSELEFQTSTARSSVFLIAGRIAGNAGFFATVVVLARALGPSGRGTIAFVTVVALILAHVAGVGVTSATQILVAQREESRPRLLSNLILFSAASGALLAGVVAALLLFVDELRPPGVDTVLLVLLIPGTVGIALVEAGYYFLSGAGRFRRQALITATVPWLYALALVGAAVLGVLTVTSASAIWVATTIVWAAVLFLASIAGTGFGRVDPSLLRESIRFGARAWAGSLALFLTARVDQVLLALLASEAALGIYAVAVNAAEVALYVPAAAVLAFTPVIARTEARERSDRVLGAFRQLTLVTVAVVFAAGIVGAPLLPLVFGQEFDPSVVPFLWLLPGALGYLALQLFSTSLLAGAAPGLSSIGASVALGVSLALDLALIPRYEATGAAIAATAGFVAGGVAAAFVFWRHSPFAPTALVPRLVDTRALLDRLRRSGG